MSHKSFVWLCLLPLAVVTTAFFLLPMARLVAVGAEGPQGLAGYLAILTEPRYRATLMTRTDSYQGPGRRKPNRSQLRFVSRLSLVQEPRQVVAERVGFQ